MIKLDLAHSKPDTLLCYFDFRGYDVSLFEMDDVKFMNKEHGLLNRIFNDITESIGVEIETHFNKLYDGWD